MIEKALTGNRTYWAWITGLILIVGTGIICYIQQLNTGLGITGMGRNVSWGIYIANLTFFVGIAASAVILVIPYYLHNQVEFKNLIIFGEFLAVAAVIVSILFVLIDLGQITRAFNLLLHPNPSSILFWDMVVLSVYLLLNLIIGWSMLDAENKSEPPRRWIKYLIIISIPWAISIHTVTAFIYSGLVARPFWLTAILAPRFLSSAFASGPSLLILIVLIIGKVARFTINSHAVQKLAKIILYALVATIFFLLVEIFTAFYSKSPDELGHFSYLLFSFRYSSSLSIFIWISITFSIVAIILLSIPRLRMREGILALTCVFILISIWIDKGLGFIIPGFVPSPNLEFSGYCPTLPEIFITFGIWAFGVLILSVFYKVIISIKAKAAVCIQYN